MTTLTLIAIGAAWSGLATVACSLGVVAARSDRRAARRARASETPRERTPARARSAA